MKCMSIYQMIFEGQPIEKKLCIQQQQEIIIDKIDTRCLSWYHLLWIYVRVTSGRVETMSVRKVVGKIF